MPHLNCIYDVPAPAKLNLFLHVTGRRNDGFHLIQSVFMLIDWCDTLHFELRTDGKISRTDLPILGQDNTLQEALPDEDLAIRAARALQIECGTSLGVHITLEKRIPSQSGMGGGSSDAATCLLALKRLWGICVSTEKLNAIALKLGADVPFFLSGGHAWVEGIGEKVAPLTLPSANFLVVKTPAGLSTQSIFTAPALKRDTETATLIGFAAHENDRARKFDFGFGRNDLQPVAQDFCPQISQSLNWLSANNLQGRMTGSGSAVFAHLPHDIDSSSLSGLPDNWIIRKCSNLAKHPLANW